MPVICHLFGGITPFNIRDLTYRDFRDLAVFADSWIEAQKEG